MGGWKLLIWLGETRDGPQGSAFEGRPGDHRLLCWSLDQSMARVIFSWIHLWLSVLDCLSTIEMLNEIRQGESLRAQRAALKRKADDLKRVCCRVLF